MSEGLDELLERIAKDVAVLPSPVTYEGNISKRSMRTMVSRLKTVTDIPRYG